MKIGQIESQYGLKRKEIRYKQSVGSSLHLSKQNDLIQNKSMFTKPLQDGVHQQISFKGFGFNAAFKNLRPTVKTVPQNLTNKVFESLKKISEQQYTYYKKIKRDYLDYIIEHEEFRKQNGITDSILEEIKKGKLIYLPKKNVAAKFVQQLFSPLTALYKGAEKLVLPKNSQILKKRTEREQILKNFAALEGLLKSHEIWENGYRKMSGHNKFTENSKFLIPDDILLGKINRRRNKVVDPNKGKYSSNSLMIGNRLISGIVYSYFLGTDAYNTTMRYSNNKEEAANQRKSRVAQEFSRIGMNMYIQNLLFGTFETAVNRSLPTAMFVSGSTVAFSEILGRKLVGKPIMPSNKETLDKLEQEMYEKKGILPSIGRLLTNVKKREPQPTKQQITPNSITYSKTQANEKLFGAFAAKTNKPNNSDTQKVTNNPSFKGYYKVEKLIEKDKLQKIYKILEQADSATAQKIKEAITKSINKTNFYTNHKLPKPSDFDDLIQNQHFTEVPFGSQDTAWGKLTKSILVPVNFVKRIGLSTVKLIQKSVNAIRGKKNNVLEKELNSLTGEYKATIESKIAKRLKLPVWRTSPLSNSEKRLKIYKEIKSQQNKDKEEIEGAKNMLLWLDKQIKREKIEIQPDGTLSQKDLKKVKDILKESVMRADGEKQLEYDGNTLAQTNINLSRAITTLFLVTDAYNLTMQYSNDNKKDANKSAQNRAAQEISRISVSAYMMAFVHNLLSKLCNSSLAGAFTLTALTSSINDSISREVVGVPLRAKTQEELDEIDKKNQQSKSPIKKALAYSIGKKSAMPKIQHTKEQLDCNYLSNDFFIKPQII